MVGARGALTNNASAPTGAAASLDDSIELTRPIPLQLHRAAAGVVVAEPYPYVMRS